MPAVVERRAAAVAAFVLLAAACALVATSPVPAAVELAGGRARAAHARLVAKASADALAKALPSPAAGQQDGTGSKTWRRVVENVKEAAQERMKQLGAMLDQERESDDAMANAAQETKDYNVLSFAHAHKSAPADHHHVPTEDRAAARAAHDAEGELSRYSAVAGSGADAYHEDQRFMKMERERSSEHRSNVRSAAVPALSAASDLLARYGKLASAGVYAYHTDSSAMQADALKASKKESRSMPSGSRQSALVGHAGEPVAVGTVVDVLSQTHHWRKAKVEGNEAGQVLVHYDGFEHKYDEWIPTESKRIHGLPGATEPRNSAQDAATSKVANEFSHYASVAVAGQDAYEADAEAAAAGNKEHVRKQYMQDEMRGDKEALKTAARYSQIAALGTREEQAAVEARQMKRVAASVAAPAAAPAARSVHEGKRPVHLAKHEQMDVVQAAAQAAVKAAAGVVDEAKAAVEEVEGSQAGLATERPQEKLRAKSGGAKHGRGRLGSSTERTYAQVGRLLALAATTAKAEGNLPVSKQVAQEEDTLAKLRSVPGKLPVRMQHNLVSAGASLLRRLGIGAGATHVRQSTPLTANKDNAVLAVASSSEGSSTAKMRAIVHLHQLHARAHSARQTVQQRLSEESDGEGQNEPRPEHEGGAEEDGEEESASEGKEESPEEQSASGHSEIESRREGEGGQRDEAEEAADDAKPAEVQPPVQVQPPFSSAEERRQRREQFKSDHAQNGAEDACDAACQRARRRAEWRMAHEHGHGAPKREPHHSRWEHRTHPLQDRKIERPATSAREYGDEAHVEQRAAADGCWVPKLPEVRKALCTPAMYKDGTCEQVWGDVPEITGPVEAFALKRVHVPGDSSKLHLEVVTAPYTQMAEETYGSIMVGYQKRADGASWQYESHSVASSSPWSTIGFFENAPDMVVKDCKGGFLGVISMDPQAGAALAGQETEAVVRTSGVFKPEAGSDQAVRAQILGENGKESLTMLKGGLDVLGDDVGMVRYHLYTTDTRRLVGVMGRRRQEGGGLDWVIRLEKDGPLDVRVAGILAAQLEAESMHEITDMKAVVLAVVFILLGLLLVCCLMPIVVRWYNERSRRRQGAAPAAPAAKAKAEAVELPHTAAAPNTKDGIMSARSIASSYAHTATSRGMTPRTDGGDTLLSTGRDDHNRGDFWDRLPALDEPTPRDNDYYQAPLPRPTQTPSMAPLMQAASLRGLPAEDGEHERKIRAMLAQHQPGGAGAGGGPKSTPRGWEATSFRDTQRSYRDEGDLEIRDVLHNVLDPVAGGEFADSACLCAVAAVVYTSGCRGFASRGKSKPGARVRRSREHDRVGECCQTRRAWCGVATTGTLGASADEGTVVLQATFRVAPRPWQDSQRAVRRAYASGLRNTTL